VGKEIIGDGRAKSARVLDGTVQVDRIPMNDRSGYEAPAPGSCRRSNAIGGSGLWRPMLRGRPINKPILIANASTLNGVTDNAEGTQ
jgi:hypothetical protein